VGNCQYKMERLPQKFEIWKYNADEDMKVIEFCTQEVIEEIDKVSDSIKIAAEAITAVYNQQVDLNSTHESKINKFQKAKNTKARLKGYYLMFLLQYISYSLYHIVYIDCI